MKNSNDLPNDKLDVGDLIGVVSYLKIDEHGVAHIGPLEGNITSVDQQSDTFIITCKDDLNIILSVKDSFFKLEGDINDSFINWIDKNPNRYWIKYSHGETVTFPAQEVS